MAAHARSHGLENSQDTFLAACRLLLPLTLVRACRRGPTHRRAGAAKHRGAREVGMTTNTLAALLRTLPRIPDRGRLQASHTRRRPGPRNKRPTTTKGFAPERYSRRQNKKKNFCLLEANLLQPKPLTERFLWKPGLRPRHPGDIGFFTSATCPRSGIRVTAEAP